MKSTRITTVNGQEQIIAGHFLTEKQLEYLCQHYAFDLHDGFVSNNNSWISSWLEKNGDKHEII